MTAGGFRVTQEDPPFWSLAPENSSMTPGLMCSDSRAEDGISMPRSAVNAAACL